MSSIIDSLFSSDFQFAPNWKLEDEYASILNIVSQAEDAVKKMLSPKQWALVSDYTGQIQNLHALNDLSQFRRGFILGAKIMLEVVSIDMDTAENS